MGMDMALERDYFLKMWMKLLKDQVKKQKKNLKDKLKLRDQKTIGSRGIVYLDKIEI